MEVEVNFDDLLSSGVFLKEQIMFEVRNPVKKSRKFQLKKLTLNAKLKKGLDTRSV